MISIRPGTEDDIKALCLLDVVASQNTARQEFIRRSVDAGECFVFVEDLDVIGYGVLNYVFYDNGFIDMIYVDSDRRRQGVGARLLRHLESLCKTSKLFTSTNQSKHPDAVDPHASRICAERDHSQFG